MPTTLRPAPVRIEQLSWDPEHKLLTADISDLGPRGLGQVYADSTDVGLTVIGATGREMVFVLHHTEVDRRENEVRWYDLRNVSLEDYKLVRAVRLWND
jgi:hypothetical protein